MRLIEHFFRIIAPHECLNCQIEGGLLCNDCAFKFLSLVPERCYRCYKFSPGFNTCQKCRQHTVLKNVYVRCSYNDLARKVVHSLKFTFARDTAKIMAREMALVLPSGLDNTIVTHVPTITTHIRQRGFDHTALIASELSTLTSLPHVNLLARIGQNKQVGSNSRDRRTQTRDSFRVLSPSLIKGMNIFLVDDVTTTGSTLENAALMLKDAGAKSVSGVCFAQVK